mgnify:CR=1 FL=1
MIEIIAKVLGIVLTLTQIVKELLRAKRYK